ncbi:MAG: ATP-binding protein [Deltaproteobacteria bacterium]|nr:ATP-binding protein [Deltaproteobacteria bacterium]
MGKHVAAFANGAGGLLFVGVDAPAPDARPQRAAGVIRKGRSELSTRLDDIVRTTVQPTPRYSIGVCTVRAAADAMDSSERQLAVVRVEAGDWPPYMFTQGNIRVIAVRGEGSSRAATLLEVEAMFARRGEGGGGESTERALGMAREWALERSPEGKWSDGPSVELAVVPRVPVYLSLNGATDELLAQTVGGFWWGAVNLEAQTERRKDNTRICLTGDRDDVLGSLSWRLTCQAGVGWAVGPLQTPGTMGSVYALHQSATALLWAEALLAILGVEGPLMLRHQVLPSMARWDLRSFDHKIPGVNASDHVPDEKDMQFRSSTYSRPVDSSELANPVRLLTDIFTLHFREQAGALVDSSEFSAYIETKVMPDAKPRSGR